MSQHYCTNCFAQRLNVWEAINLSDEGICPNCGSDKYAIYHDWKPFNLDSSQCYDCGFHTMTTVGIDSLEDLNLQRYEMEEWRDEKLKPLKELREQTQWAKDNMKLQRSKTNDKSRKNK